MFNVFFSGSRAVYEIMWKNTVDQAGHRWQYVACAFHGEYL